MTVLSYRRCIVAFTALVLIAEISGCSFDRTPIVSECVRGRAVACACDDGLPGASVCAADGVFSACSCIAPSSGGQGGSAAPPIAGSAGTGVIGGASGSSGEGVTADDDALPVVDAGGSAGAAATDGMTATDGDVDASTDDMTDGAIVEAPEPKPGERYGACRADGSCDASLFCTLDVTGGGGATYCSQFCSISGLGVMCPAGPSGTPGTCIANVCTR